MRFLRRARKATSIERACWAVSSLKFDGGLSVDSNIEVRNLSREARVAAGRTSKTKVSGVTGDHRNHCVRIAGTECAGQGESAMYGYRVLSTRSSLLKCWRLTRSRAASSGGSMDQIVLLKIESLHARVVQEAGIKLRQKRREFFTGSIAAHLEEKADPPANLGLVNLTTGAIHLRWAVIATLPIMADAFAAGEFRQKRAALRVSFDEVGQILKDGSGFDAKGWATVAPGSLLGSATVDEHSNFIRAISNDGKVINMARTLASGNSVRCAFSPIRI